jgi:hypothetical protein
MRRQSVAAPYERRFLKIAMHSAVTDRRYRTAPLSCLSFQTIYIVIMRSGHGYGGAVLEQMLEPIGRRFGPETARALVEFRVSKRIQARVEKLAEKCNEGKLTPPERAEYEEYVQGSTMIGILQAKARKILAKTKAA